MEPLVIVVIAVGLVALGQLVLIGYLVWWHLRSEGRIRPVSVEKTAATRSAEPQKRAIAHRYGGHP